MKLITKKLTDIKPYPNNPRNNDNAVDAVAESIKQCGYVSPIIVDEDGVILAGHTRYKALQKLGIEEAQIIVKPDLTEEQKKKYRILDNKTNELAEWDDELLQRELDGLDFDGFDFGFDEMSEPDELDIKDDGWDENAAADIKEPTAQRGQIWRLGNHVLMCGDSTDKNDVAALMAKMGGCADLLLTDPPYNVNINGEAKSEKERQARKNGKTVRVIENDNMSDNEFYHFLNKCFENASISLKPGGAFYIWYASANHSIFQNSIEENGLLVKEQLIWVKNSFTLGRQDYQWKHEPCFYGWKDGASHYFIYDRKQSTVTEDMNELENKTIDQLKAIIKQLQENNPTTVLHENKPNHSVLHPTTKPIKLISRQISNSTRSGEIVLDLFGGSGTTLIACEQLGRRCAMMEYDPVFADCIIKRWEDFSGSKAVRL